MITPNQVSLIIPTYNRQEIVFQTLQYIKQQSISGFEVVLVDQTESNDSNLNNFKDDGFKYKYLKIKETGLPNARNVGAENAKGDILIFIDDDSIPDSDLIQSYMNLFNDYEKDKFCIGGRIIEKNTTIPTKKSQVFSTAEDNQPAVSIKVLQGEREMAGDNKPLGNFELLGIAPAPRGMPQIEVTFDIDANGIVNVSAKDKGTGKEQKIQIQASGGLSDEDINKMVKEAEANKDADKKKREAVDARNQADTILHTTEKNVKEHGSKVAEADKKAIETASADLRNALKGTDIEDIKKKTQNLIQSSMKLGEAIYKDQQAAAASPKPEDKKKDNNNEKKDDNVVDADFEEVKDENKEKSA